MKLTQSALQPAATNTYDLGGSATNRWENVWAQSFRGGTFYGTIDDSVSAFSLDSNVSEIFTRSNNTLSAIDPGSTDRLVFWDDSESGGMLRYLSLGTNLSIDNTNDLSLGTADGFNLTSPLTGTSSLLVNSGSAGSGFLGGVS